MRECYYTIRQLADMLGVSARTLQYVLMKRKTWSSYLEKIGYNGKSKECFLRLFELNRENGRCRHENSAKAQERKREGKCGSFSRESPNVIALRKKEKELLQIEEEIKQLEADMEALVFDRDINSKLQALYLKRRCVREWLGIKDNGIVEEFYL